MAVEVGSIVEGKVTGITKFGAFVELPDGKKYKSLRNKAVKTGKGTWKFVSDNIDYDVLIEE